MFLLIFSHLILGHTYTITLYKLSLIKRDQYLSKRSYLDVYILKFRFSLEWYFKKWKQFFKSYLYLDLIFFANDRLVSRFFISCFHCNFENSTVTFKVLLIILFYHHFSINTWKIFYENILNETYLRVCWFWLEKNLWCEC